MVSGQLIGGRFQVEAEAGVGGMATVYRARDMESGERVALKVIQRRSVPARPEENARFTREAVMLGQIRHPAVVRYVTHGTTERGELYLAMEWLEGEDLQERLARESLTIAETLALASRVAEALAAVHSLGFIHRDLKPSNLFLVDGRAAGVKLLDFGVALSHHVGLTVPGMLVGTPGYMAPEQARARGEVDQRADVFSLGCVMFKCLTGVSPFEGNQLVAVLAKVLLEEAPLVSALRPGVPAPLASLVARMLSKLPENRPRSAVSVAAALSGLGAVEEAGAPAFVPSPAIVGLTGGEQRMLVMLLIRDARADAPRRGGEARHRDSGAALTTVANAESDALVKEYEGNADTLMDGTRLVTFAAGGVATDLAVRAARCALALRVLVPESAMALAMVRSEIVGMWPIGDAIDRAAMLLARAARAAPSADERGPRPIAVDDTIASMLEARFDVIAGSDGFALGGPREPGGTARTLLGHPTPCVGRTFELSTLHGMLRECVDEPVARALLLTASAGMGKSRILHEFLTVTRERVPELDVWIAQGDSLRAGSALELLAQAIRGTCGILQGETLETRRHKLKRRVAQRVSEKERGWVAEFLGEIVDAPFEDAESPQLSAARKDPRLMNEQMRRAWEELVDVETAHHPVLLVLEDLQWGDLPTARFVGSTLRHLGHRPFMVLALARPEVQEVFPHLWADGQMQRIRLNPLSRKAGERLVRQVLGEAVSAATAARIAEQSDGNVFYLEELIRAVAGGTAPEPGVALPETVLAMVQARFEGLESVARRVLRAASVFGNVFWPGGVAALLGEVSGPQTLGPWLSELLSRELLVERPQSRFAGEPELSFRHSLLREGAYAMLTERDRELGHRLAGAWLERHGESDPMLLAQHFERGKDAARAVGCYLHAAEQALRGEDQAAAIERAERAVALGASGPELGALRRIEAESHLWRGELSAAEDRGVEAVGLLAPGTEAWFRAVCQASIAAGKLGATDRVARWSAEVSAAAPAEGALGAQIICLSECATSLLFGGRYEAADPLLAALTRTAKSAVGIDAPAVSALQQVLAIRSLLAGDVSACLEGFEAALVACEQAGDRRNASTLRSNLGFVLSEVGDFEGAENVLRVALSDSDRMGTHDITAAVLHNLGRVLAYRANIEEGRRLEMEALRAFDGQGNVRMAGTARSYLAQIALLANEFESAEREARSAAEMLVAAPPLRAVALAVLARALLHQQRVDEALTVANEALTVLESLGEIEEGESLIRLAHVEALCAANKTSEAAQAAASARTRLLTRAAKITAPTWRERFLTAVPAHARTLVLAAQLERRSV